MAFSPTTLSLVEDGRYLFTWTVGQRAMVQPIFHMQVLDTGASLSFDVGEIYSVPPVYVDGDDTPWDYAFSAEVVPADRAIGTVATDGGPQISYGNGYARFSAIPLDMSNTQASLVVQQRAPAVSVQIYRLRINTADGDETKVTLPGGQILRRAGGALNWQFYTSTGAWQTLAASGVVVGAADYTIVAMVTSGSTITLFENGVFRYQFTLPGSPVSQWQPAVAVQHLTAGTNVSVDLGGIRTLPVIKTPELLAMDLRESTLALFPLISDFTNVLGNSGDLVPAGGEVGFVAGPFGRAANFAGGQAALSIPPLAAATAASYTLSAWVLVNGYPPAGTVTGIAGALLLDSDGRLVFRFLYNGGGMYQERRYVSDHMLSLGVWHNVVVTYSYEEARLGIYVDGRLHCLEYMGEGLTTESTSVPSSFFVGGEQSSADAPMVVLNGAVSMVIILTQHVHQPTVAVFAQNPSKSEVESFAWFIPVVILVVAVVVEIALERYYRDATQPTVYPSLDKLVANIRNKTGVPATPGVRVTRADIGSPSDQKIHLDFGGEGYVDVGGLVVGFKSAINVTAPAT
ncbi:LamG-like jellyroll fold domain-containing protein, partial [Actinomadura sp. DC4]|uniref:LamG-like jellyroll fold domain-containing protein n=1 Tax=Actinomadura sp. DC4 TaxID=3055069 RepID=UPI0025B14E42